MKGSEPGPGVEFAGHLIEKVIGVGGMGVVYRARNLALDQDRALKILSPTLSGDERFRERFKRESRQAASIEHPNVIPVHQAGEEAGHLYLAMRLVDGADLRQLLARDGPLSPDRATSIVGAAAAGLQAAHDAGLIHRDVKPANVLVGEGRDAGRTYITDFGISRTVGGGETVTSTGELVGTADFMSPEQVAGDTVDHRADVYALGAVLYFALTGQPPFRRENEVATLFAHSNAPRPRPSEISPEVPAALDAVVARAMAISPDARFQSAAELGVAIDAGLMGTPPPPPSPTAVTRSMPSPRRRISYVAVGATLAVLVVVALVALFTGDAENDPSTPASRTATKDATVALHASAKAIAVGDERVWVAANGANKLIAVDRTTHATTPYDVEGPKSVAVGFGSVWVVSGTTGDLHRLNPIEGSEPEVIELGDGAAPSDVAVDDQWVWVANAGTQEVVRIDPDQDRVDARIDLGTEPRAVATGGGSVWVTNIDESSVTQIDADPEDPDKVGDQIAVGVLPVDVAVGEDAVWVACGDLGEVYKIDPASHAVDGKPIDVGSSPRGIVAGLGFVWVALGGEDAVAQIDPTTRELVGPPVALGEEPSDLALADDAAWASTEGAGTAVRLSPR